jgi:Cdc6-like AAA superfamily ATPase
LACGPQDDEVSLLHTPTRELLERDRELAALAAAAQAAPGGSGRALLIEGSTGIGKTALVQAVHEAALAAGLQVLRARGGELESDFGFGVVVSCSRR